MFDGNLSCRSLNTQGSAPPFPIVQLEDYIACFVAENNLYTTRIIVFVVVLRLLLDLQCLLLEIQQLCSGQCNSNNYVQAC